jgi:quercetin dioxygenase-like cupin family protein
MVHLEQGIERCGSRETARGRPPRGRRSTLPARCASTRCSSQAIRRAYPAGHVTFEPGARSAWHTHPLGQTLIVTSGLGWAQAEGGPIEEIRPGDVVWFPPGLKHWHGATPATAMSHIAITEFQNGKNVDWLEKVSDEQYRR